MATLQKIRNRGTLLMVIVGLALFAFIVGDAIQNSSSYFGQAANMVGEINGEPISYEDFRRQVSINTQNAEAQSSGLSSADRENIEQQTWNQIVERKIVGEELSKLGIKVTADELSHIFVAKTDNVIQNAFGSASAEQIATQISAIESSGDVNQKAQLNSFKEYVKEKRTNDKYYALLSEGLKAGKSLMKSATDTEKVNFKYVMRAFSTVPDTTVVISDAEVNTYYEEHKELFRQTPSRKVVYVQIDVEPSQEDRVFTEKTVEALKKTFAETKDPMRFASINSETQPSVRYLKKDEIQDKELAAYAFSSSSENTVYGPYGIGDVFQITRVADKRMLPDSVRASHILIAPGENSKILVDSLTNLLTKKADFETLAKTYSVDKGSAVNGGDLGWFSKGVMIPAFEKTAFEAPIGKIVTVETQFGTHIIKVAKRSKEFENVQMATVTKEITPSNKTFQLALTDARRIAENVNNIEELNAAATEANYLAREAILYPASMGIQGIDNSKAVVRAAFTTEEVGKLLLNNENSTVFEMDESYVIVGLKEINDGEYANVDSKDTQEFIKGELRKEKKAEILKSELANAETSSLEALAEKEGVTVQDATDVSFNTSFISGLGQEPSVVAAAILGDFTASEISKPIAGTQGVFVLGDVAKIEDKEENDIESATSLYNQMLNQRIQMAYQALYRNAKIIDERFKF